jgi:hypothetical protein
MEPQPHRAEASRVAAEPSVSRLGLLLAAFLLFAGGCAGTRLAGAPHERPVPRWLTESDARFLDGIFGGGALLRVHYLWYPRKLAVVFEFKRVAICGACSAPSNALLPRGRFVRITYDRRTRRMEPGLMFCERGRSREPSRSFCLRR